MTKQEFFEFAKSHGYDKTGESEYAPDMSNDSHAHEFAFAAFVLEGQFKLSTESEEKVFGPGDMWSLEAGVEHAEEVIGENAVKFVYGVR